MEVNRHICAYRQNAPNSELIIMTEKKHAVNREYALLSELCQLIKNTVFFITMNLIAPRVLAPVMFIINMGVSPPPPLERTPEMNPDTHITHMCDTHPFTLYYYS